MSININLFYKRTQSVTGKSKAMSKDTADLYKVAMNLVMDKKAYDLDDPQDTARHIVAKHFMRKGQLEQAESLIARN